METTTTRPTAITALALLHAIDGLLALVTGSALLLAGQAAVAPIGFVIIGLTLPSFAAAVGLWMLRRWGWWLALILAVIAIPFGLFGIVQSGGADPGTYLGIVTGVLTLVYLPRAVARRLFA